MTVDAQLTKHTHTNTHTHTHTHLHTHTRTHTQNWVKTDKETAITQIALAQLRRKDAVLKNWNSKRSYYQWHSYFNKKIRWYKNSRPWKMKSVRSRKVLICVNHNSTYEGRIIVSYIFCLFLLTSFTSTVAFIINLPVDSLCPVLGVLVFLPRSWIILDNLEFLAKILDFFHLLPRSWIS